jgi:hypothetical protein
VRIFFVTISLAACTTGDPKTCRIETYADGDEKGQTNVTECGSFTLDADAGFNEQAMKDAHDCVLDAVAHAHAFTFFYDVFDPFRHLRGAFTGVVDKSGKLQIRSYAYVGDTLGGSFDPRPAVTSETCATVIDAACAPAAGKPCLTCKGPGAAQSLCHF